MPLRFELKQPLNLFNISLGSRYTDRQLRPVTVYGQGEGSRYTDKTGDSVYGQKDNMSVYRGLTGVRIPRHTVMPRYTDSRLYTEALGSKKLSKIVKWLFLSF